MKLNSVFRSAVFLVLFSCTIIEDSDLITPADFEKIRLTGIELVQEANNVRTSATMTVSWDSVISQAGPQGILTRSLGFELKNFQEKKLKFKSGAGSSFVLKAKFYSDGHPFRFDVIKSNTIVERYVFRYNDEEKLARLVFFLGIDNVITSDTILYDDAGKITAVEREEYTQSPGGDIMIEEYINGPPEMLGRFRNTVYTFNSSQGNCPNNNDRSACFSFFRTPNAGGGGDNKQVNFYNDVGQGIVNSLTLQDQRYNVGVSRDPDTYYFHPMMILKNYFQNGDDLLALYMVDWYSPGADQTNSNTSNFDEQVKFNFLYGI